MAGQVLKVLLTSRIFDYPSLLENLKEVSIAGIISSQLDMETFDTREPFHLTNKGSSQYPSIIN
jgi:hypothetical protein